MLNYRVFFPPNDPCSLIIPLTNIWMNEVVSRHVWKGNLYPHCPRKGWFWSLEVQKESGYCVLESFGLFSNTSFITDTAAAPWTGTKWCSRQFITFCRAHLLWPSTTLPLWTETEWPDIREAVAMFCLWPCCFDIFSFTSVHIDVFLLNSCHTFFSQFK